MAIFLLAVVHGITGSQLEASNHSTDVAWDWSMISLPAVVTPLVAYLCRIILQQAVSTGGSWQCVCMLSWQRIQVCTYVGASVGHIIYVPLMLLYLRSHPHVRMCTGTRVMLNT